MLLSNVGIILTSIITIIILYSAAYVYTGDMFGRHENDNYFIIEVVILVMLVFFIGKLSK